MEAIIALIVGIVLISLSIYFYHTKNVIKNAGIKTEGVVFDIVDSQTLSLRYKTPVIRFLDANNQWVTEEAIVGVAFFHYKQGDKVSIIYHRDNPKKFIIQDSKNDKIIYMLLTGGIIISIVAVTILIGVKF